MGAENLPPTFAAITLQLAKMTKRQVEPLAKKVAVLHLLLQEAAPLLAKECKTPTKNTDQNVIHINPMLLRAFNGLEEMVNDVNGDLDEYLNMMISLTSDVREIFQSNVGNFDRKQVREHCKALGLGLVQRSRVNEIVSAIANTHKSLNSK